MIKQLLTGLLAVASLSTLVSAQKCFSMDGQALDAKYQPCYPDAEVSACCQLNGTQGADQQNDICLDSGLCQSTSGWYAGFLYINGCTDQTLKSTGCPQLCSFMGNQYSWSVLQCEPGVFCCRAASDNTNCCGDNSTTISTSHIGNLLLPGSTQAINTTYNATNDTPGTSNSSASCNSTSASSPAQCPADNSAVVGGAVGGVLGAALIGALVALAFMMRSRKHYKSDLGTTRAALTSAEVKAADEKANLQKQLEIEQQQRHAQSIPPQYISPPSSAYVMPGMPGYGTYSPQYQTPMAQRSTELPHTTSNELSELGGHGDDHGRVELTSEVPKH